MDLGFRGHAYVLVGGSNGMGWASARPLAEGGAKLAIVSRSTSSKDRAAALVNFTKNVAKTYGAQGIRANCICPGAIETEQLEHLMFEEWKMPVAMRSVGQPDEVADLMAFALSDRARYMTGAAINIDEGTDF